MFLTVTLNIPSHPTYHHTQHTVTRNLLSLSSPTQVNCIILPRAHQNPRQNTLLPPPPVRGGTFASLSIPPWPRAYLAMLGKQTWCGMEWQEWNKTTRMCMTGMRGWVRLYSVLNMKCSNTPTQTWSLSRVPTYFVDPHLSQSCLRRPTLSVLGPRPSWLNLSHLPIVLFVYLNATFSMLVSLSREFFKGYYSQWLGQSVRDHLMCVFVTDLIFHRLLWLAHTKSCVSHA